MIRAQQNVRVARIDTVPENIKRFELVSMNDEPLPVFSAGSHIVVTMREGEHVWRNPYSIMGATNENRGYVISVQRSSESRGGSEYMHTKVDIGSHLEISEPVNLFALAHKARKHIFLAGGIGITPMLAMLDFCKKAKESCELHYAVRSDEAGAKVSRRGTAPAARLPRLGRRGWVVCRAAEITCGRPRNLPAGLKLPAAAPSTGLIVVIAAIRARNDEWAGHGTQTGVPAEVGAPPSKCTAS